MLEKITEEKASLGCCTPNTPIPQDGQEPRRQLPIGCGVLIVNLSPVWPLYHIYYYVLKDIEFLWVVIWRLWKKQKKQSHPTPNLSNVDMRKAK